MKTKHMLSAAALALTALATPALAQAPGGLSRADVQQEDLSTPGKEVIQVVVGFEPGAFGPPHRHPGEEIIYVLSGTLDYQIDGSPPVRVNAGEGFFVPAGAVHSVRNVGSGPARELATYVVTKGQPLLVPPQH